MSAAKFLALTGPVLWHFVPAANLPGIAVHGILRPATLAREADEDIPCPRAAPHVMRLGRERFVIPHQQPLLAGAGADFLDGYTLAGWAAQLDRRLQLWPDRARGEAFVAHLGGGFVPVAIDAARIFATLGAELDLAPINTAAALVQPARRGDWIYVPAAEAARFAANRAGQGKVTPDLEVAEVTLRGDLTLPRMALVLAQPLPQP